MFLYNNVDFVLSLAVVCLCPLVLKGACVLLASSVCVSSIPVLFVCPLGLWIVGVLLACSVCVSSWTVVCMCPLGPKNMNWFYLYLVFMILKIVYSLSFTLTSTNIESVNTNICIWVDC